MKLVSFLLCFFFFYPHYAFPKASVSPILFFFRNSESKHFAKLAHIPEAKKAKVTVRFASSPDENRINELQEQGMIFKRENGSLLHTKHIYLATVELDSLESLSQNDDIIRIESTFRPSCCSTLNVSNPQVQASRVWDVPTSFGTIDGREVIVTNVDTGIDIYHPGFFFPDGGTYEWIDVNSSGRFESSIDSVDLNSNGISEDTETLCFFDASFSDPLALMERTEG
ncbi:MAG TPA: hypothetical protein VMZ04_01940, partial [Anaerolineae bacterium]|nr:hypothetical protein [Anaerolineae bacterium]